VRQGNVGSATPAGLHASDLRETDPSGSLFGAVELDHAGDRGDDYYLLDGYDTAEADDGRRGHRGERATSNHHGGRHSRTRRRRNRRFVLLFVALFLAVVAVGAYLIVTPIYKYLHPSDYSGAGTGEVLVTVHADDGATQIGTELHNHDVVASVRAFTNAAADNVKSKNIQPGSYRVHRHMSAKSAVQLLLDPTARVNDDVLVPEGVTTLDVTRALTAAPCTSKSDTSTRCGPGLGAAAVRSALTNVKALGVPTEYTVSGRTPASVEGFLFPATYLVPDKTTASDVLQQMVNNFAEHARQTDFTASAKSLHITPYQQLIIASIAQAEARYVTDYPRVARVILNRLAAHKPLQIDATSAYGAKLKGLDPTKVIYSQLNSPYNTYTHLGLPPTPIGNPGIEAMNGAAHPSAGANWVYYVNGDKQGHLAFFASATEFDKARHKCHVEGWGCAGP
jgi:UPF0755 protein